MNLNKAIIVGRLTADPQVRSTPSGQSVSSFSVATNRFWRDANNERHEETEFHNIVCWGRQAEIVRQFVTKGSMIMIEGRLKTRSWQDKDGQTRRTTEIICEQLQLGPKPAGAGAAGGSWANNSSPARPPFTPASPVGRPIPPAPPREEMPTIDLDSQNMGSPESSLPTPTRTPTENVGGTPTRTPTSDVGADVEADVGADVGAPPSDQTKDDDLPF